MTTTDTPRTDLKELELSEVKYPHDFYALVDFCRDLERELNASEAEVKRLRNGMQGSCYCCEPVGEMNQKLEAEIKRLKQLLLVSDLPVEVVNKHTDK